MTLKEMKVKTFSLIEEYYPGEKGLAEDEDVLNKINGVINQIQLDLMKYRKISAKYPYKVRKSNPTIRIQDIPDIYQLNKIVNADYSSASFNVIGDYEIVVDLEKNEEVKDIVIYYYKYPELVETIFQATANKTEEEVKEEYDNSFEFELDNALLEIMPYGVAADLLKMDMISNYGKYFYERYLEMKNSIDSRKSTEMITIVGGADV